GVQLEEVEDREVDTEVGTDRPAVCTGHVLLFAEVGGLPCEPELEDDEAYLVTHICAGDQAAGAQVVLACDGAGDFVGLQLLIQHVAADAETEAAVVRQLEETAQLQVPQACVRLAEIETAGKLRPGAQGHHAEVGPHVGGTGAVDVQAGVVV